MALRNDSDEPKGNDVMVRCAAEAQLDALNERNRVFGNASFFSDPGWTILLTLKMDERSAADTTMGLIVKRSDLPQTTVQRWLALFENVGLVSRSESASDRRAVKVSLTEQGSRLMEDAISAMIQAVSPKHAR